MDHTAHGTGGKKQPFQNFSVKGLEDDIVHLNEMIQKTEKEWAQMVIKLKRERMVALAALSRSKLMLAEMEIFIAENELNSYSESSCKKIKLTVNEDNSNINSKLNTRRQVPRRRSISSNVGTRNFIPSSNTSYRSDCGQDQSSSSSVNGNSSNNRKVSSTYSPSSVTSLSMLKSNSSSSSSSLNKHLTDSIIAEFEKPYQNTDTNNNNYSNIHKWSMSAPNSLPQKESQVKINPMSNVDLYKKSYSHERLSYTSHLLYAPDTANMRTALHPKDPRDNSKLLSQTQDQSTMETPISLAVPQLTENIYVSNKAQNIQVPVPSKAGYVPPTRILPKYKSISTFALRYEQTLPASPYGADRLTFKHISNTQPINRHIPISTPQIKPQNLSR